MGTVLIVDDLEGNCRLLESLLAQIMGVVDVFDALTTARPYKAALRFARAAEEPRGEAARSWRRPDLVATFLDQVERGELTPGPAETGRHFGETQ
jgi:HD-GYP domain-containing protein (c-di-GMP phosphodiesterase class II)